jgi:membrane-anchored protein YejM (alkaline phosphatase superfamily)
MTKRTSHYDIPATIISDVFGCNNPASDYCSGNNLFTNTQWDWLIVGSYYNFAILEENQITVTYPGGYFELRDNTYKVISNKNLNRSILSDALNETKRFYNK